MTMKWIDVPEADQVRLTAELDQVATLVRNVKDPCQVAIMVLKVSLARTLVMVEQARTLDEEGIGMLIDYLAEESDRVSCLYETLGR
jgi:hypothetical protein